MKDILVMFSGGKDSFLTACRLASKGYKVHLLSFNNGCVFGEEAVRHGAQRLINRFGDRIEFDGIYLTVASIRRFERNIMRSTVSQLNDNYGSVTFTQLRCAHCQTAMWAAAIAYCVAKAIPEVACGYRKDDLFCTGSEMYRQRMVALANKFNINVQFPVLDSYTDTERDNELCHFSFMPQVFEPKCMEGMPAVRRLEGDEETQLLSYLKSVVFPQMEEEIKNHVPIFIHIRLTDSAIERIEAIPSDGSDGIY